MVYEEMDDFCLPKRYLPAWIPPRPAPVVEDREPGFYQSHHHPDGHHGTYSNGLGPDRSAGSRIGPPTAEPFTPKAPQYDIEPRRRLVSTANADIAASHVSRDISILDATLGSHAADEKRKEEEGEEYKWTTPLTSLPAWGDFAVDFPADRGDDDKANSDEDNQSGEDISSVTATCGSIPDSAIVFVNGMRVVVAPEAAYMLGEDRHRHRHSECPPIVGYEPDEQFDEHLWTDDGYGMADGANRMGDYICSAYAVDGYDEQSDDVYVSSAGVDGEYEDKNENEDEDEDADDNEYDYTEEETDEAEDADAVANSVYGSFNAELAIHRYAYLAHAYDHHRHHSDRYDGRYANRYDVVAAFAALWDVLLPVPAGAANRLIADPIGAAEWSAARPFRAAALNPMACPWPAVDPSVRRSPLAVIVDGSTPLPAPSTATTTPVHPVWFGAIGQDWLGRSATPSVAVV
ncbi:hypothetical protein SPI_08276 [Niveomyces insectorum RCEF 264]|uniref:Uncharacterized protein n=1 Tax=Niveomyces insectorum RCEF 264 TaxID=1081102 RepID=A0A167NIK9_9HYPO|nr:hypothetical protein SPI_08276 [Niveomyces insectorum RCEF 264]